VTDRVWARPGGRSSGAARKLVRRVRWRAGQPSIPPASQRAGGRAGPGERGALTLSYVIIVPVFLAALLFIAQFALWFLAREAALAAARQGTDAARQFSASRQAGPETAVAFARRHGSGFLLSPAASAAGSGQATVQITVTGKAPSLVPGLTVRVREVARAPVERFTTP
jgi:Flp pilus assembly protein TadG